MSVSRPSFVRHFRPSFVRINVYKVRVSTGTVDCASTQDRILTMASSRWKRFAFFDRHTLSFPSEVLEDLVPVGSADKEGRRSIRSLTIGREVSSNDSVSLVVTTASLPFASKPKQVDDEVFNESKKEDALDAMWSSLVACTSADVPHDNNAGEAKQPLVQLPSQRQLSQGNGNKRETSVNSVDGLVLAFVTSRDTELIHCFDVTVRCNPPPAAEKDLEDLDGWRGYFAPFSAICTRAQDGPASDDADGDKVVGIAACRHNKGNGPVHLACISDKRVVVWEDPHIHLSCRQPLTQPRPSSDVKTYTMQHPLSSSSEGHCLVVDIVPGIVAVGMDTGAVLIYVYTDSRPNLRTFLKIPPPPADGVEVVAVKMALTEPRANIFVAYRLAANATPQMSSAAGVCCYEMPIPGNNMTTLSAPSARHDLDGRYVGSSSLVDAATYASGMQLGVVCTSVLLLSVHALYVRPHKSSQWYIQARPDGVYSYSRTERTGVAPIDGTKLAFCVVPPPIPAEKTRDVSLEQVASGYSLVASTDAKSGRDAVDLYDSMNKLVAYHLLLSPGHRALRAAGVTTMPTVCNDGSVRGGRSSAVILTSGGNIVTLTEKLTEEKIDLLVQKNLYSAAIVVAYADPSYEAANITDLYCQHAEYLYRKGDFSGSMEQYCHTIGSLESSHVIFRFLDAPKIPLLVKYLEKLRALHIATAVHNELLRTCYLKLNDTEAADAIAASASSSRSNASMSSILSNLSNNPKDALVTICSLEAEPAAEILVVHGPSLARVLPRETAGIVIALCLGTYSPKNLADAALIDPGAVKRMIERGTDDRPKQHEQYPFHLFSSAFLENPKMLRLILTHCNRNKCYLTPFLRRTLLELTLAEWNQARRSGDKEAERLRYKEVIAVGRLDEFFAFCIISLLNRLCSFLRLLLILIPKTLATMTLL